MRSGFGKAVQQIRSGRGMTQSKFAELSGWSLSRISNIEFQRAAISDDVLRVYLKVLNTSRAEAHELRKLACFSNGVRKEVQQQSEHPNVVALLRQFGKELSPKAIAEIQKIIESETGERVSSLTFASNQMRSKRTSKTKRVHLQLHRFVEICILASRFRREYAEETHKLDLEIVLERLASENDDFDLRISEALPSLAQGAFAVVIGEFGGVTLHVEEDRYAKLAKGVHFCRHVVAHEVGHYVLHRRKLDSDGELLFEPQSLAQNSSTMIGTKGQIEQVVDTLEEAEAECFATMLLVPWESFLRGTTTKFLASDYGEQQSEVERYMPYFKQRAVIEELKSQLWKSGETSHPIFHG
ncbi:helix-turn-helix transcriptional regulator [uncultured Ruegeria sp.]|uniref:helix-turn-helix domain-containing protein n=1 Tax=uncultured Ruegeria sp. TaxID=259304 RepID=UPI00261A16FE|nr:XRE family transcriptional regulator [uncultured Ruegeria sp.]